MSELGSLRERVARALYENTRAPTSPWDEMPPERKRGWLSDADVVIPIVAEAAARVPDQRDPEKPTNYLFRRERIGDAIRGLLIGWNNEAPELLATIKEAEAMFRWYGDLHAAKPDHDKAKRNYDMADKCAATIAKAEGKAP
mgnify:CR=1 FL=1